MVVSFLYASLITTHNCKDYCTMQSPHCVSDVNRCVHFPIDVYVKCVHCFNSDPQMVIMLRQTCIVCSGFACSLWMDLESYQPSNLRIIEFSCNLLTVVIIHQCRLPVKVLTSVGCQWKLETQQIISLCALLQCTMFLSLVLHLLKKKSDKSIWDSAYTWTLNLMWKPSLLQPSDLWPFNAISVPTKLSWLHLCTWCMLRHNWMLQEYGIYGIKLSYETTEEIEIIRMINTKFRRRTRAQLMLWTLLGRTDDNLITSDCYHQQFYIVF